MSYLDLLDNIIRTTPITIIQIFFYLSIVSGHMKFIYYAVFTEVIATGSNYVLKDLFINYDFAKRPFNPGYINSHGISTGCGIYPGNNLTETSGLPSYHAQIITFATIVLIYDEELMLSYISIFGLIIILSTIIIERVIVRCHTILQVIIGTIIGYITAHIFKYISIKFFTYVSDDTNTNINNTIRFQHIKQFGREKWANKLTVNLLS